MTDPAFDTRRCTRRHTRRFSRRSTGLLRLGSALRTGLRTGLRASILVATILVLAACQPDPTTEDLRQRQAQGDYAGSIEPLRAKLQESPDAAELHYLLGVALRKTGTPSLAVWPLLKAVEDPEWFWPASVELVQSASASENYDLAIRVATDMIERDDTRFDAWFFRAEAHIARRQDFEQALEDVERALDLRPDSYAAALTRASTLLLLQRSEEAQEVLDELDQLVETTGLGAPERAKLCVVRTSLFEEDGRHDEARQHLDTCIDRFPSDPLVVQTAVGLLEAWGERDRARQVLSSAVERAPASLAFRIALSQRLQHAGREAEAERLLREIAEGKGPAGQRRDAWVALADHFLPMERYADAADAVGRALALAPDPAEAEWLAYADLLAMAGQDEAARRAAERLERSEYRDLIEARILLREGKPSEALEHLDRVLKIWPGNAAARYYAARAAEQTGALRRAISEYRDSIRADAGFTDAGLRLARLHLARREFQPAVRAAYHHLNTHAGNREAALLIGEALLAQNEPIPEELRVLLWSPDARRRWIELQAAVLRERRGPEAALGYLERIANASRAEDPDALRALVTALVAANRVPEARSRVTPGPPARPALLRLELEGIVLRAEGNTPAARQRFGAVLERDPENESVLLTLADLEQERGAFEEALSLFDRATAVSSAPWQINHRTAELLVERGRPDEARRRLEDSLREHPHDVDSLMLLGKICHRLDNCRLEIPEIARRAAFLGGTESARTLTSSDGTDPEAPSPSALTSPLPSPLPSPPESGPGTPK